MWLEQLERELLPSFFFYFLGLLGYLNNSYQVLAVGP